MLDTAVRVTKKSGESEEYSTIEEASHATGLSISAIKIRCNKSRQGGSNKKDGITCMWIDDHTFRHFNAKKNHRKGDSYELKVIKELSELGYDGLVSSRSESKRLDDSKIDIADPNNILDFYVQCKATANVPSIVKINREVGKKDKPLAIFWDYQNNSTISEEFVIIPKKYFYKLIKK